MGVIPRDMPNNRSTEDKNRLKNDICKKILLPGSQPHLLELPDRI